MKLPDQVESEIEALLEQTDGAAVVLGAARQGRAPARRGGPLPRVLQDPCFPKSLTLRGLKLVVDCAHGANYRLGVRVFQELGAEVIAIASQPNGVNINEGVGATHPKTIARAVVERNGDFGISFDGDGDRLFMADRDGTLFDGDQLLYAMVKHRKTRGVLAGGVVGTLMTNFALESG
jgi:phosphoglucosamine mutase